MCGNFPRGNFPKERFKALAFDDSAGKNSERFNPLARYALFSCTRIVFQYDLTCNQDSSFSQSRDAKFKIF